MSTEMKEGIARALANPNLTGALGRFSEAYVISRAKAYEGVDFEALRDEIVRIKGGAAEHLEELAAEFKKNAEARGAKVVICRSGQEVKDYILSLAKAKGLVKVVKSKSMATEEIHLNPFLAKEGLDVQETDLGEWIIQLAGQRPSHMVMPAIHLTKEEVADIFSKEVNERIAADIPRLVKLARNELRTRFLEADLGISGANVAVAQTGSLVVITNEGNARLVTTLPRVHVAVVGFEKLVPAFEDAIPILRALPKSATSQLLTSYVSIMTGPAPGPDGQPKELHVILMDNRRNEMAADPKFKQALQCIRCASCLNVCPVYRLVGGHVFGDVYAGGIGTILTAWFNELKKSADIQGLCIQCGRCVDVCPGKIDIPELIVEIRRRLVKDQGLSFTQKAIFQVVNNRKMFHSVLRAASVGQKPFAKEGFIRHLPMFLSGLADFRSLPAIAEVPLRDEWEKLPQPKGPEKAKEKAAFFAGCLIDFAYPEMGKAVAKVLNAAGVEVVFPKGQTCCGAPARYSGAYDVAAQNAIDNIKAFEDPSVTWIVSACATCTAALKHEFSKALETSGREDWLPRAKAMGAKVMDFSTLVKQLVDAGRLKLTPGEGLPALTYHDSCHLKRTLHVTEEPRALLKLAGHPLNEMFESDICCGMGGSYSIKFPEISAPILTRKLDNVEKTGVPMVTMDCPGCVMQIRGGLDKRGSTVEVKHIAELLAKRV